jgi:predicted CoA-substrate-specific enzyme activase
MDRSYLGIDVGSTTVKVVVLDREGHLLGWTYLRSHGQPRRTLLRGMAELGESFDLAGVQAVGLSGSGGGPVAALVGGYHVNELVAQTRAIGEFHPQARTVIEIGGQDSKFLSVEWDARAGKMVLLDFAMNNLCAAGTGSFLDQQAERLGISIEDFARIALQSETPARIAGRCTVFAKSDIIHLQQRGTPLPDTLAGLSMALARNFKSVIGRGKRFTPPVVFQGGVAYNQSVVRAFERVLGLDPGELIVPEHRQLMVAIGAALAVMDEEAEGRTHPFHGLGTLRDAAQRPSNDKCMPILPRDVASHASQPHPSVPDGLTPVYLGIDVGSITTKVALVDEQEQVIAHRYLYTEGKPLETVRRALSEVGEETSDRVRVLGVGVTGSGRYLTADFCGGDVVRSEITAQARAAIAVDPTVDTIFEIGGQDSKYVCLDQGAVVSFAMNTACAAGTGSFLEEQADRLQMSIERDFSHLAFDSSCPAMLGERCTVFMESDLVHYQQQGAKVEDLTAGLAYAIVENYTKRVVGSRLIGKNIFFQGGVAGNDSVVAAFQQTLGRPITVPPYHEVSGAIGAALLAKEELETGNGGTPARTRFKGFDLRERRYESSTFVCKSCPNLCEINRVDIADESPIFYGARCDIFDRKSQRDAGPQRELPDLFAERMELLLGGYAPPDGAHNGRPRVGIPRALYFYDMFPYWRTFFDVLGMDVVLSAPTNPRIAADTKESAVIEACYPAKLVYGHVIDLLNKPGDSPEAVDLIFLPSIIDRENIAPGQSENKYCPYIPAMTYLIEAMLKDRSPGPSLVKGVLRFLSEDKKKEDLTRLAKSLGATRQRVLKADAAALEAQRGFYKALRLRGREVLTTFGAAASQGDELPGSVIIGRPYNVCDLSVSQDLPHKLRKIGVLAIPMDYLPLETVDLSDRYGNMFWRSGQDILAAGRLIRQDPRLQAIYINSFICGPDSFLINYFRHTMRGKPFLEIEIDDHTADAGIVTRCEAFFESLRMRRERQ